MANVKDLIVNGDARIVGKLYANQSMPDGVFFLSNVSGTAAVTSSPYTSAKWYTTANDSRISSLYSGLTIALKIPVAGNDTYGTVLNVNGLGDHPVVYNINSMIGNRYSAGSTIMLVYNATQTATGYANSASATTYTGCWQMEDYDSTNTYQLRDNNANIRVVNQNGLSTNNLYRYQLCLSIPSYGKETDDHYLLGGIVPYNGVNNATTNYAKALFGGQFDPFGPIYYYSSTTTVNAGSNAAANALFQHVNFDCRYSMNIQSDGTSGTTALTPYKPVYIKAKYENGFAYLHQDSSSTNYLERSSIVQELPITDPTEYDSRGDIDAEFVYIYLGRASSKYQIELDVNHPVYKWINDRYAYGMYSFIPASGLAENAAYANYAVNAGSADKAITDPNGNSIINTYATKDELNTAIGNITPQKITLNFNTTYVYETDLDYICFRLGNLVFLFINTLAFKVGALADFPNYSVIISGLPKPASTRIFYLQPNGDYNRFRADITSAGNVQRHWSADPISGDTQNKQYSGFIAYEATE